MFPAVMSFSMVWTAGKWPHLNVDASTDFRHDWRQAANPVTPGERVVALGGVYPGEESENNAYFSNQGGFWGGLEWSANDGSAVAWNASLGYAGPGKRLARGYNSV